MTEVETHNGHHMTHAAPPRRGGWHRLLEPGWLRVLWVTPIFFGLGVVLGPLFRAAIGYERVWDHSVWLTIELAPAHCTPMLKKIWPGGWCTASGA